MTRPLSFFRCAALIILYLTSPAIAGLAHGSGGSPGVQGVSSSQDAPSLVSTVPIGANSSYPLGVTTDGSGNVWFAQDNLDSLAEFVVSNSTFRTFAIPTPHHLAWIWFMIFDQNGMLWFSDESQPLLWSFDPATGAFANYTAGSAYPMVLQYDQSRGRMWFTSLKTGQVGYFDISGGKAELGMVVDESAPLPGPGVAGIAVDSAGNAFVAESFQARIVELDAGNLSTIRTYELPAGSQPVGLAMDTARGRLWFTNHASSFFGFVSLNSGSYTEYPTSLYYTGGAYAVTLPYWIAVASSGYVWFNEHIANRIGRFDPGKLQLTEFDIPTNNSSPLMFSLDDARGEVWFTEFGGNALGMVDQSSALGSSVSISSGIVSAGPTATLTSGAVPPSASPTVSVTGGSTGEPQPEFEVRTSSQGSSYQIALTAYQAKAGNYTGAICFSYPSSQQCGYLTLIVPPPGTEALVLYSIYAAVGFGVGGLIAALAWGRRRGRLLARPP